MNSITGTLEFVSRECKNKNHNQCHRRWHGLGFEVICSCKCSHLEKKVLEEVRQPESNTNLRVPDPLNVKDKECDTKYGFTEDKDKSFDVDSAKL